MIQELLFDSIRELNTWKMKHKDYMIISCNRVTSDDYSVIFEDGQENRDALGEDMEYLCMPERQPKPFENNSPEVNVMLYDGVIYRGHYNYDNQQWIVRTKEGVQGLEDDEVVSWHYLREDI
jgi:hypothetical protein